MYVHEREETHEYNKYIENIIQKLKAWLLGVQSFLISVFIYTFRVTIFSSLVHP